MEPTITAIYSSCKAKEQKIVRRLSQSYLFCVLVEVVCVSDKVLMDEPYLSLMTQKYVLS
jgi:hypothetical protein